MNRPFNCFRLKNVSCIFRLLWPLKKGTFIGVIFWLMYPLTALTQCSSTPSSRFFEFYHDFYREDVAAMNGLSMPLASHTLGYRTERISNRALWLEGKLYGKRFLRDRCLDGNNDFSTFF